MIVVNIMGGLGNQMFQYACGQSLAWSMGLEVRYATDTLGTFSQSRSLALTETFGVALPIAGRNDISRLIGRWRSYPRMRRILSRPEVSILRCKHFIAEQRFAFIRDLSDRASGGAYLHGYWQSEQYFKAHERAIRAAYRFKGDPGARNRDLLDRLHKGQSIGIHVRRGDYASNLNVTATHGLLEPKYYLAAIEELRGSLPNARVFIFSDDPEWVAGNLLKWITNAECVSHNIGESSFRDMQLMAQCDALVIANSSFSWWAGWLNERAAKHVIAPRQWFADAKLDASMVVPESWLLR